MSRVSLILTAHGSADPRSGPVVHLIAREIRALRPGLDVRVAFCERTEPNLRDVLGDLEGPGIVTPVLLASAYHARVDIPAMLAEANAPIAQADVLGEDTRLVEVLEQRITEIDLGARRDIGVLVVAVGSSHSRANAATATLAGLLSGDFAGVEVAYATGPQPAVGDGIAALHRRGVRHIAVAPWFIAPGRITDRVAAVAAKHGVAMAEPLGAHPLVAATVLDRFDHAVAQRLAA